MQDGDVVAQRAAVKVMSRLGAPIVGDARGICGSELARAAWMHLAAVMHTPERVAEVRGNLAVRQAERQVRALQSAAALRDAKEAAVVAQKRLDRAKDETAQLRATLAAKRAELAQARGVLEQERSDHIAAHSFAQWLQNESRLWTAYSAKFRAATATHRQWPEQAQFGPRDDSVGRLRGLSDPERVQSCVALFDRAHALHTLRKSHVDRFLSVAPAAQLRVLNSSSVEVAKQIKMDSNSLALSRAREVLATHREAWLGQAAAAEGIGARTRRNREATERARERAAKAMHQVQELKSELLDRIQILRADHIAGQRLVARRVQEVQAQVEDLGLSEVAYALMSASESLQGWHSDAAMMRSSPLQLEWGVAVRASTRALQDSLHGAIIRRSVDELALVDAESSLLQFQSQLPKIFY